MWIPPPPPLLVSWNGKCFCCPSWIERSARLRPLWCEEMSGATAGQRLGQWQPTLGARVFFCFFFLCVSPNVGQVKVSRGNKGFIKAPVFLFGQHMCRTVAEGTLFIFFNCELKWQKRNWPFPFSDRGGLLIAAARTLPLYVFSSWLHLTKWPVSLHEASLFSLHPCQPPPQTLGVIT